MHRYLGLMLLTVVLVAFPMTFSGCAARVYDMDHRDYHHWNRNEIVYYQRWEVETHRDHRDFNHRSDNEKKEYWNWRHARNDRDHR